MCEKRGSSPSAGRPLRERDPGGREIRARAEHSRTRWIATRSRVTRIFRSSPGHRMRFSARPRERRTSRGSSWYRVTRSRPLARDGRGRESSSVRMRERLCITSDADTSETTRFREIFCRDRGDHHRHHGGESMRDERKLPSASESTDTTGLITSRARARPPVHPVQSPKKVDSLRSEPNIPRSPSSLLAQKSKTRLPRLSSLLGRFRNASSPRHPSHRLTRTTSGACTRRCR